MKEKEEKTRIRKKGGWKQTRGESIKEKNKKLESRSRRERERNLRNRRN
jgi:hypothetical protein